METSSFYIRKVHRDKISEIAELWLELKEHHHQRTTHFSDYYQNNSFEVRQNELLSKEKLGIFVAEREAKVVGFCVVSLVNSIGEVDSLYVRPTARNLKIGKELMSAGLTWLEQRNPKNIRLMVGEGNEEVIKFYEQLGFVKRATQMEKR